MLFNSVEFILGFLPIVLVIYYLLISRFSNSDIPFLFLIAASLFFYGWWEYKYLILILCSIIVNYKLGCYLIDSVNEHYKKIILVAGVSFNILLLAYFKYADFFIITLNYLSEYELKLLHIVLPLAISFFTFQQIAYLVDAYRREVIDTNIIKYLLFVTFFPQLIAGPIVHHREMMSQFTTKKIDKIWENLSVGITMFTIGLAKKLILADQMSIWSDRVFTMVNLGYEPTFIEAWIGALCFGFQIYFDFSAYSDMAIGLARMFGIKLPQNFESPYKSRNIIEFWRRWHITLSRFLRDYLYFALGGNRKGKFRRYLNLFVVMIIGGLWHGASWTFVAWGGLHGIYLMLNHFWKKLTLKKQFLTKSISVFVTFLFVTVAWVFFRAEKFHDALEILQGMFFVNDVTLPAHYAGILNRYMNLEELGVVFGIVPAYGGGTQIAWIICMFIIVWFLPNTQELMRNLEPTYNYLKTNSDVKLFGVRTSIEWKPYFILSIIFSLMLTYIVITLLQGQSGEFIYFQF